MLLLIISFEKWFVFVIWFKGVGKWFRGSCFCVLLGVVILVVSLFWVWDFFMFWMKYWGDELMNFFRLMGVFEECGSKKIVDD